MDIVEQECLMHYQAPSGDGVPVPTQLSYRRCDPYAVRVDFDTGGDTPVTWVFARDLLAAGMVRPSGRGDVRLWPTRAGQHSVLNLALFSFDGEALLTAPLSVMVRWLQQTYWLVPAGHEASSLDLDDGLSRLLGEAA